MRTQTGFHRAARLGMAALVSGLAACGSKPMDGIGPPDTDLRGPIAVAVTDNVIQVPEGAASVPAGKPGVIKWTFAKGTSGYVFPGAASAPAPGIVFKLSSAAPPQGCANAPDPNDVMHNCKASADGSEFQCNAKKMTAGDCCAYTVTVVPKDPSAPAPTPLDPWIRSQ